MKNHNTYPIEDSPFFKLSSRSRLARLLNISNKDLRKLSKSAPTAYSEFDRIKKNGGKRRVENPARPLKLVQARVARLLSRVAPPDYLFCPVKGRCYVTNAAKHRGNRVVRCLDIRKYFPNTPSRRVFWFFHTIMKCERDIAAELTTLATYKRHLPTGSPLSPILAYFAYIDVWDAIAAICKEHSLTLTVYIDDVTISGSSVPTSVIWQIKQAIHKAGLLYHKEKSYIDRPAEITGVIVAGNELRVPNRQHKKLAEIKSDLRNKKNRTEFDEKKLNGRLVGLQGQINQVKRTAVNSK